MTEKTDIVIIGAGAAVLMCAIEAGKRGRSIVVLDRAEEPGQKILVSDGFSGYDIARQFGLNVWPLSPGLVPLILDPADRKTLSDLRGIGMYVTVTRGKRRLSGELLFTHKGLSGPVILQTSLYWHDGEEIVIDFLPGIDLVEILKQERQAFPNRKFKSVLGRFLPIRVDCAMTPGDIVENRMAAIAHGRFRQVAEVFGKWRTRPAGVAGYDCAEVTLGGVDCDDVLSKTMEARSVPGLFLAGEVLDVSGWLGGYNLQWAWSSGWCAGQHA